MCIYICIYVYVCLYIYVYVYMCVYVCVYIYVCMYINIYTFHTWPNYDNDTLPFMKPSTLALTILNKPALCH